jgi:hypothetical protein
MRLLAITSLALGLACELTSAKSLLHGPRSLHRRYEPLEEHVRRQAFEFVDAQLKPRQEVSHNAVPTPSTSSSSGPPANLNDPTTNMTIATACLEAFTDITNVSNAAGWAACYNVLYLNNQTGIFEADLRLYQVSPPTGSFAGIQTSNIHLALNYPEAAISATSQAKRSELATRQLNSTMSQLQQYSFVGQIDRRLTLTQLKAYALFSKLPNNTHPLTYSLQDRSYGPSHSFDFPLCPSPWDKFDGIYKHDKCIHCLLCHWGIRRPRCKCCGRSSTYCRRFGRAESRCIYNARQDSRHLPRGRDHHCSVDCTLRHHVRLGNNRANRFEEGVQVAQEHRSTNTSGDGQA